MSQLIMMPIIMINCDCYKVWLIKVNQHSQICPYKTVYFWKGRYMYVFHTSFEVIMELFLNKVSKIQNIYNIYNCYHFKMRFTDFDFRYYYSSWACRMCPLSQLSRNSFKILITVLSPWQSIGQICQSAPQLLPQWLSVSVQKITPSIIDETCTENVLLVICSCT